VTGVIKRTEFIFEHEMLRSAAGLDDIKSMVLDATKVNTTLSGTPFRYIVPAGAVLAKSGGSGKVLPIFMNDGTTGQNALAGSGGSSAYVAADIVGVLSRTVELIVSGVGAVDSKSDTDVSVLHHGCDFDITKLYGYNGTTDMDQHGIDHSAAIKAALPTCLFR